MDSNTIALVDCTLREGNQAPGVQFSVEDSIIIAEELTNAGINNIEIGHPYASKNEFDRVAAVHKIFPHIDLLAHARAKTEDIHVVAQAGASWVGIFAGVNELSQKYRFQKSQDEIFGLISAGIRFAKTIGLRVRFTVEDASRTSPADLILAYKIALDAGADRICYADSVGICDPDSICKVMNLLRDPFPGVPIEVHLHDDRGLALANALAALSNGATHISCSVNGLGERCGITDTCTLIANMQYIGVSTDFHCHKLTQLSNRVSLITKSWPDARRPAIGKNSFTHTSKLHVAASSRDINCYHWIKPSLIGREPVLLSPVN